MATYTLDRASATLTVDQIGRTQSVTPEGFLLCEGVRIARTGPMLYRADEVEDVAPNPSGAMTVLQRDADVLFAPDTLASFAGKPVTNDHPDDLVSPETWRSVACGIVMNPRRGEGADSDHMVADLLITEAGAIADIQAKKREVSCGYDTEVEEIKPGLGRVTKIVGNHVALVERGRCGPSCAIQDGEPTMAKAKRTVWDRLTTAFKANDEAAFHEEIEAAKGGLEAPEDDKNIHVHVNLNGAGGGDQPKADEPIKDEEGDDPTEARFAKIEAALNELTGIVQQMLTAEKSEVEAHEDLVKDEGETEEEAPAEPEEKRPVMDAAAVSAEFRDTLSRAEILAPGIKLPVFDAKAAPKLMVDAMCGLRRRALAKALDAEATRPAVEAVAGKKPDFAKMTCDQAATVFRAASEVVKARRTAAVHDGREVTPPSGGGMTAARLQELNEQRRKAR